MTAIKIPPKEMCYDGPWEEYESNGKEYFKWYKEIAKLVDTDRILDIGCGLGRKTQPLLDFLTSGLYVGIDCKMEAIKWCQENIWSREHPNFIFEWYDIRTPGYNPEGKLEPRDFTFPGNDNVYDLVVMNSVFTHMRLSDIHHYLKETYRVLKPNGRCFITWFLQDEPLSNMPYRHSGGWMASEDMPEQAISYHGFVMDDAYIQAGLTVSTIHLGHWTGRKSSNAYQDIVLAIKEPTK